jgi:predicted porin
LRLNAGLLSSDAAPKGDARKNRYDAWTAGMSYDRAAASFAAEYYSGQRDKGASEESVNGYYLSASYSPIPKVDVLGRYQSLRTTASPEATPTPAASTWASAGISNGKGSGPEHTYRSITWPARPTAASPTV